VHRSPHRLFHGRPLCADGEPACAPEFFSAEICSVYPLIRS
jgi:hypothetical protein